MWVYYEADISPLVQSLLFLTLFLFHKSIWSDSVQILQTYRGLLGAGQKFYVCIPLQ